MSWRDRFQEGSFRGVPFLVESSDLTTGRRIVVHEYAARDDTDTEDLGRRPRSFQLEVFVLGDDYMSSRDRLVDALETFGPGRLVHPYLGTMQAIVEEVRLKETTRKGGKASFSITFRTATEAQYPRATEDTSTAVASAAAALVSSAQADLEQHYSPTGQGDLEDENEESLRDLLDLTTQIGWVIGAVSLAGDVAALASAISSLIARPSTELESDSAHRLYLELATRSIDRPQGEDTPTRRTQARNLEALEWCAQRTALAEACRLASGTTFETSDEATERRQELVEVIDELVERESALDGAPIDDTVWQSLVDLRAAVVRDLTSRGAQLPRITEFVPVATLPALVIAHRLYDDLERDAEIVARNRIVHPGFVPGGVALEVLTDV